MIVKRAAPQAGIAEATEDDLHALHRTFACCTHDRRRSRRAPRHRAPSAGSPDVATEVVGFVQLVRIEDPDSPWKGYWLFSLLVRARYRGLVSVRRSRCA